MTYPLAYTLPSLPTTFFDSNFFDLFEGYVRWFMKYNMPIFMICAAVVFVGYVLDMIIDVQMEAKNSLQRKRRRSEDEEED